MVLVKDQVQYKSSIEHGLLFKSLVNWAAIQPDSTFLVEADTGRELSYAQTLSAVSTLCHIFGKTPRHIMLALPGGIANAICWLSALSGGHHLIPMALNMTDKEKLIAARRYQTDVLVVEREDDARGFATPQAIVLTQHTCEMLIEQAPLALSHEPREGWAYLTTSGSTGEPKGVVLSERQIAWTASHVCESHNLSPRDRGLTVLPFFHVNAPVVSLCASLLAGSTVIIARRFSRREFWTW